MAFRATQRTIGTTPSRLTGADGDSTYGTAALIRNLGTSPVFIGGSGVTTATGYRVDPDREYTFELGGDDVLWAVAAVENVPVAVLEEGV
jgi:hypothetical protein